MWLYAYFTCITLHYVENCKLMHKLKHGNIPVPVSNLYQKIVRQTRGIQFTAAKHRHNKFDKSFRCKPITDWQYLPDLIRDKQNCHLKSFTTTLKSYLLKKY